MAHRAGLQGNGNPEALGAANDCYTQVLTRHPAAPEAAFALTGSLQVCAALGREGEASARLADLCRTATAPSLLVSVADAAYQSGAEPGWRLAVIGYRRAAEIAPTDSNAPLWLWRATCAAQRIGDVAEATRLQGALRAGYPTSRWAALPPPEVPR
jgi:hypothetical protein